MEYIFLKPNQSLQKMETLSPFKAVVVVEEMVDKFWQAEVSNWLVASGCFYMMAWGVECSSWDDSVDWASLDANDYQAVSEDKFVVTTWHEDDSIEDVFWYAKFTDSHNVYELSNLVVIHIAQEPRFDFSEIYEKTSEMDVE
jgi:hypothetical protein